MDIDWVFAPTGGGDVTGVNDPVTTTFKGDISYHLARESIQNIIDARDPKQHGPVIAEFELIDRQANQLHFNETLKKVLVGCRDFNRKNKDAVEFYNSALFKIEHNNFIPILRVSDYNTVGLTGDDDDRDGNYFQLMKAVGDSSKSGNKGGSFGLGKGAYYAASSFRSIFVSSVYGKDKYVFQGKARLSSYSDPHTSEMMQGNGSFGLPKQKPVRDLSMIPHTFQRTDMGTDFYIVGFVDEGEWKDQMMKSVLNHFWYTISMGHLEVTIQHQTVNRTNLELLMKEYFDETQPDKTKIPNPWPYYLAFTSNEHKVFTDTLPVLGKVKLFVLMKEDFPQKVIYMRQTGMMIQKKGIGSVNGYAAVFVCDDDEGNLILQKMENPEHNEWNKENALESVYAEKAERAEKELREFVGNSLKALTGSEMPSSSRIGQLEDYLYLPGDRDIGSSSAGYSGEPLDEPSSTETGNLLSKTTGEMLNPVPVSRKINPIKKKIVPGTTGGELPTIDGLGEGGHGGGGKVGPGDKKVVVLDNIKFRTFANRDSKGKRTHVVLLKGPKDKKCFIDIKAGTDDSFDTVDIVEAKTEGSSPLKVRKNIIDGISLDAKGSASLIVKFAGDEKYSLSITAYENK